MMEKCKRFRSLNKKLERISCKVVSIFDLTGRLYESLFSLSMQGVSLKMSIFLARLLINILFSNLTSLSNTISAPHSVDHSISSSK